MRVSGRAMALSATFVVLVTGGVWWRGSARPGGPPPTVEAGVAGTGAAATSDRHVGSTRRLGDPMTAIPASGVFRPLADEARDAHGAQPSPEAPDGGGSPPAMLDGGGEPQERSATTEREGAGSQEDGGEPIAEPSEPSVAVVAIVCSGSQTRVLLERGGEARWGSVPGMAFGYRISSATSRIVTIERGGRAWVLRLGEGRRRSASGSTGGDGGDSSDGAASDDALMDQAAQRWAVAAANPYAHLSRSEKRKVKREDIRQINTAIRMYSEDYDGKPPLALGGINPYLKRSDPVDPFTGRPYYLRNGRLAGPGAVVPGER